MDATKSRQNTPGGSKRILIISGGLLLCFVILIVSLYPALQNYYITYRMNEQLLHELAAVEIRNEQIIEQIKYLNTEEGIADRARERFGWVPEGEHAVNITGLDVSYSTTLLPESVAAGSVSAPEEWWTAFLDAFFAVEEESVPDPIPDPFISEAVLEAAG